MTRALPLLAAFFAVIAPAWAHEVRPAHLKVSEVSEDLYRVRWMTPAMGNRRIAIDPIFPDSCAETGEPVESYSPGASVRSWRLSCPGGLADASIGFSNLSSTMIDVLVQITFLDGRSYTGLVRPSDPVFRVPVRNSKAVIFYDYFALGVGHILFGWDHLLFVLGMVLLVTSGRRLIWAITGFTVAHSLTLGLAMFGVVRVPGPPVEAVIALSIVLLAVESIRYHREGVETLAIRSPWVVSMAIGLIHGLGFAGALSQYGLPPYAEFVSLLAFNSGVEVGQLSFVALVIALGAAVHRIRSELLAPIRVSAMVSIGVCGSFWLVARVSGFFF